MDWMEQEQERGITITSAATTTFWKGMGRNSPSTASTSSTPRAVDFTIEVERSMRVLDGAVMVYCAVVAFSRSPKPCGVKPTSIGVPRVAFVNKMDRQGANFFRAVEQVKTRLRGQPGAYRGADRRRRRLHRCG